MNDTAKTKPRLLQESLTLRQYFSAVEIGAGEQGWTEQHSLPSVVPSDADRGFLDEALPKSSGEFVQTVTEHSVELLERQQFFEDILKISPNIIYVYDLRRRQMVYLSRQVSTLLGYSAEKAVQQTSQGFPSFFHPEDWPRLLDRLQLLATAQDEEMFTLEYRLRHRNGEWRWFLDRERVFARNSAGTPTLSLGVLEDIHERKRAEAALRAAEEEYRAIFEHANLGIYRSSLEGKQLRANPALVKLNGYTSEEEMLATVNDIATEWYVDPRRRSEFVRLLETYGQVENFESEVYRHKTRERIWISETARLIRDQTGAPLYYEGTVQDITARKQAEDSLRQNERRYRGLVESQQDLIVRVDPEGRITFANDAYCRTLGKRREELLGQSFLPYVYPDDHVLTINAMKALSKPPYRMRMEQRIFTPGGVCWFAWEDYAVRNEHGAILEIQAVGRDITDRKQIEQKVRNAQEDERKRIARELHDGVAQLLVSARIHLDLADGKKKNPALVRSQLAQSRTLLAQALRDIRSLVWTLRPPVLNDMGLVDALHDLAANFTQNTATVVSLSYDKTIPRLSPEVETALYRITQEALSNSVQHAHASQVTVTLQTYGESLHLAVIDNGQGLAAKEPLPGSGADNFASEWERRGLGLQNMRERAAEINGEFLLHSTPGQGVEIRVIVPFEALA